MAATMETSLKPVLQSYIDLVNHINIQWKLNSMACTWDIRIEGYDLELCVWFLNDFAFVTFPFGYTFREAATKI